MKLRFIYTLFSLSVLAFLFMGNSGGRAAAQGAGNTGAPGDEMVGNNPRTCITCHGNSTTIMMTQTIEILDANDEAITQYVPGETYRLRVTNVVEEGDPQGFGFQALCLTAPLDQDGDDAAAFSNPANNVQIAVADNGRQYAEQDGESATNVFEVDWTAPVAGTGDVTFYACGNAVNDNNQTSGDAAACVQLELPEDESSSTIEANAGVEIFLFPNPVVDDMKIRVISEVSAEFDMEVYDMQGRLMVSRNVDFPNGESNFVYDVSGLSKGTYLVKFSDGNRIATAKLLKW